MSGDDNIWEEYTKEIVKDNKVEKIKSNAVQSDSLQHRTKLKHGNPIKRIFSPQKEIQDNIIIPEKDRMDCVIKGETTDISVAKKSILFNLPPFTNNQYSKLECGQNDGCAMSKRMIRHMNSGKWRIEKKFDLHGYTLGEGYNVFQNAIHTSFENDYRLILVITGRGLSSVYGRITMRETLPQWINYPQIRPYIQYFETASRQHGGEGAFYIVIRKNKISN